MDVSDGLLADAGHLAAASGCGSLSTRSGSPVWTASRSADAAASGEEYELVCAVGGELDTADFEARFGVRLTQIGERKPALPRWPFHVAGRRVDLPGGHDHFSDA
jgi:thiamine-monophosphate kinase